jgi:hypothetical protein
MGRSSIVALAVTIACGGTLRAQSNPLTTEAKAEVVAFGNIHRAKLSMLNWNTWHTWEHYGNVVVYLRVKGLVPPSSEKK